MTPSPQTSDVQAEQTAVLQVAPGRRRLSRVCGMVAGPLFFLVSTVAGVLRPDYDPLRHPVSSLEFGPQGWVQALNFVVTGTLVTIFAWGLRAPVRSLGGGRTVPVLLAAVGLGLVGAGFFDPDPISGYPPGTPPVALDPSLHRVLHDLFSTPVFTGLPAAAIVLARRFAKVGMTGWAVYSAVSAALMLILFVLSSLAFGQTAPELVPYGGLLQRSTLGVGFAWLTMLAAGPGSGHQPIRRVLDGKPGGSADAAARTSRSGCLRRTARKENHE